MKYVSIDIETTGLDPKKHQIIEFAAIIDDLENQQDLSKLPTFHRVVYSLDHIYTIDPYIAEMHSSLFKLLDQLKENGGKSNLPFEATPDRFLATEFYEWITEQGLKFPINVAGKNFAMFDLKFLANLPNWNSIIDIHHRILDPGMLYVRYSDEKIPNLQECLKRCEFGHKVKHTAVNDARDVISLIRRGIV